MRMIVMFLYDAFKGEIETFGESYREDIKAYITGERKLNVSDFVDYIVYKMKLSEVPRELVNDINEMRGK